MDLKNAGEMALAAISGGVVTMALSWLTVGRKIPRITDRQDELAKALAACKREHLGCPDSLLKRFDGLVEAHVGGLQSQFGLMQNQITAISTSLNTIHDHLMNGGKK